MRTLEQIRNPANGYRLGRWADPSVLDGRVPSDLLVRWAAVEASLGVPIGKYQSLAFNIAGKAQTVYKAELNNRKLPPVPGRARVHVPLAHRAEGPTETHLRTCIE